MTIPLLISESIPVEVSKILDTLTLGRKCRFKTTEGYISFVCDQYLCICYKQKPNPPGSRRPYEECNLVVYRQYWENLEVDDSHLRDVQRYKGKTEDHPGNDMLPTIDKR